MISYRSPLSRARGLGSAKEGVVHWWMQRLTAIALVPLIVWLSFSFAELAHADYAAVKAWFASPFVAILLAVSCIVIFYHSALGLRVVIEDYVHSEWRKLLGLILVNFLHILLAGVSVFFILKMAFGN